jgi:serine/threonine protein kinase
VGVDRLGRYEIVREIGRGGMGRVYEARDPELARKVAIKVLHGHHTDLFRDEARALAQLNHPGIVTIHEIGSHEARPYLVMELLVGRPLRELLVDVDQRPSRDRLVEICGRVAVAIREAHDRGVLHRDIKPENVVVLASGAVKVIDFGIARRLEEDDVVADRPDASRALRVVTAFARTMPLEVTPAEPAPSQADTRPVDGEPSGRGNQTTVSSLAASTQTVFGTPAYMAPEVLGGGRSTPASDVYSLGVLLYECIAGRRPYEGPDLVSVVAMVLDGSEAPPKLDDPLAALVMRMLARDPRERPTLEEIGRELDAHPPVRVSVAPADVTQPVRRTRRWRAATVLAGVAVAGLAASAVVWNVARQAPSRAGAVTDRMSPATVAIAPLAVSYQTYGDQPGHVAHVLALVLSHIANIRAVEPSQLEPDGPARRAHADAARQLGAGYLVTGELVERAGEVTATLELVDLHGTTTETITATAPVARNAALVTDLANRLAARVVPGAKLEPAMDEVLGRKLYETGKQHLDRQQWAASRPYLEQAVEIEPSSPRGWDALTSARAWTLAPQELIEEAVTRTLALAPAEPRRTILDGAGKFFRHDYDAAVETLEPLANDTTIAGGDAIDVAYYLGEALWHRGDHRRGVELLQRVFDARRQFQPAGLHLMQNALARRDIARAGVLVGQLGRSRRVYELAVGDYETVAASGEFPLDLHAQIILGKPSPELEARVSGPDAAAYAVAKALVAGDMVAARAAFAAAWPAIGSATATDRSLYEIGQLIDVVASSGLREETRTVLARLAASASPRYQHALRRAAALASPLAGTELPSVDAATPRQRTLIAAMRAELARDHRTAVARLTELIADPGENFDFGERIALVRNLRALGDTRAVAAQCEDLARPPVFRYDFLLARAACRFTFTPRRTRSGG